MDVLKVLEAGVSQNPVFLKQAETTLKEWEVMPGFYSHIFEVISNRNLDVSVRWLAAVTLKNGIERYWRKSAPHGMSESEKARIRPRMLSLIGEPINQIATQLGVLIGKIARYDVPHDWPELLPALIVGIQSEDSLIQERALFTLHHVIKSLASKRLAGDRKSFQNLADQLLVPMLEVWNVHLDTTVLQVCEKQDAAQETIGKSIICTKILRKLVVQGVREPLRDTRICRFAEVLFEKIKTLLEIRNFFLIGTQLDANMKKLIINHVKIIADLLERSPLLFLPLITPSLNFVADYVFTVEGQRFCFQEFAVKLMNLMKALILCAEYKPAKVIEETKEVATLEAHKMKMAFFTPSKLSQLFHCLVGEYLPLKEEELNKWSNDPEEFLHEEGGESWKYSLRPCAESLFLAIFHEYSTVMCSLLLALVKDNTAFVSAEDFQGILRRDAIYNALGLVSFELFDQIDFDNWFSTSLLEELRCTEPNYRVLRRRIVWLIGRWTNVKFSTDLRPVMYEVLLNLMGNHEDLVVRLEAAETLRTAMDDFDFSVEQFMPYLQLSFGQLFQLLKEVNECDTKLHVLNVISLMIELVGAEIKPYVGGLIQFLPALWEASEQHNMLRCSIISTLVHIVKGLGEFSIELGSFLIPVIHYATDTTQSAHVYLIDDGLELWKALVENSPVSSPALLKLYDNLPKVLEESSEYLLIGCQIMKSYLYLCPEEFMKSYGTPTIAFFNNEVQDMRNEGVIKVLGVIDQMILCSPTLAVNVVSPLVMFALKVIYEDSEMPLFLCACFSLVSRLVLTSRQHFLQAVNEFGSQINASPDSVLNRILDVWIDRMSYFSSTEKRKLMSIALISLLASGSPLVLDKICGILMRVCETIQDVLTREEDGQEVDRLFASPGSFVPEFSGDDEESRTTEHTKRQRKVLTTMDPIHVLSLPDYFKEQINKLRGHLSPSDFEGLMKTVDVETMEMVKDFFENTRIKPVSPISSAAIIKFC
ncbi:importin-11-like [Artemia franciscana]